MTDHGDTSLTHPGSTLATAGPARIARLRRRGHDEGTTRAKRESSSSPRPVEPSQAQSSPSGIFTLTVTLIQGKTSRHLLGCWDRRKIPCLRKDCDLFLPSRCLIYFDYVCSSSPSLTDRHAAKEPNRRKKEAEGLPWTWSSPPLSCLLSPSIRVVPVSVPSHCR